MSQAYAAGSRRATASRPPVRAARRARSLSPKRPRARIEQRYRELFNLACVVMLAVTIFAIARVTLSASAAATAIEAGRLNREIKSERLTGDLLECDKSSLTTPSRIECIAGESLSMSEALRVTYLTLNEESLEASSAKVAAQTEAPDRVEGRVPANSPDPEPAAAVQVAAKATSTSPFSGMLASVMELATGEAEILLVGDAGLASTR